MLKAPQRQVATIAAVVIALSGGIGIAQGSSHPSGPLATKAKGKKNHKLSADYKTGVVSVIDEGPNTVESFDNATLAGRPFGKHKADLDEDSLQTFYHPGAPPNIDYTGTVHVTFEATFANIAGHFRGFYDYSVDANGGVSDTATGVITGGSGAFKGAKGSFQVLDLSVFGGELVHLKGHWQGSIRY